MREYRFDQEKAKQSVVVPPGLLEEIADDVRAFDKAQSPEVRTHKALDKLAGAVEDLVEAWPVQPSWSDAELRRRAVEAAEIRALSAAYVPRAALWGSPQVRDLAERYGIDLDALDAARRAALDRLDRLRHGVED